MTPKIDKIDKKILYYLTGNARLSYTTISANVGLSRESVKLRIENMLRERTILSFPVQSLHPYFGLEFYNFYISFARLDAQRHRQYETYIKKHPSVMWSNRCLGRWDYATIVLVKDNYDLANIISEFKEKFRGFIKDTEYDAVLYEYVYTNRVKSFFNDTDTKPLRISRDDSSFYKLLENRPTGVLKQRIRTTLDRTDVQVLEMLSANCRATIHEIAESTGIGYENVRYRMKRMIERNVIVAFWAAINYDAFGLHWYRVRMRTNMMTEEEEKKLTSFLQGHQSIFWSARSVGKVDLHIDLRVEDNNQLNDFLQRFNTEFESLVTDYETLIMTQELDHNNFTKKIYEMAE
ncbi:MAG: Lrp/AsnC family transcriptional regulator [Candidatus Diapherotrites archaeon]|uniref:Lrp/AsnC family transcriptional regulator n=1 Tax=Candidatus Iainarchaeum sp. TaxID=3101447 RepID=A0A8T3YKV2_9ARCH|nr:Lrp/AsnC family transcriptional regulator [Candidatus Diapherotrites archaeon]